jgi:integrase
MRERHRRTNVPGIYYSVDNAGRKTFEVRYTDAAGTRRWSLGHASLTDAKGEQSNITGKTLSGEKVASASTTVADLLPGWNDLRDVTVKAGTRDSERRNVRLHIAPRWGRMKVRDIGKNDITTWLGRLTRADGKPMNEGTKALILAQFSSLMDYAVDEGVIGSNTCKALSRKAKPRQGKYEAMVLTKEQFPTLIAGVSKRRQWLVPILRFAVLTGLRLGEVAGLQWADVNFEAGTIRVARSLDNGTFGTPKGGVEATVPMIRPVRTLLSELKLQAGPVTPETPVFRNTDGGHRQPRDIQRAFVQARNNAGLTGLRFHDLRHTCASWLANEPGAVMVQVQAYLRHANLTTTLGYVHTLSNETWADGAGTALAAFAS